jgi:hypothetical protein
LPIGRSPSQSATSASPSSSPRMRNSTRRLEAAGTYHDRPLIALKASSGRRIPLSTGRQPPGPHRAHGISIPATESRRGNRADAEHSTASVLEGVRINRPGRDAVPAHVRRHEVGRSLPNAPWPVEVAPRSHGHGCSELAGERGFEGSGGSRPGPRHLQATASRRRRRCRSCGRLGSEPTATMVTTVASRTCTLRWYSLATRDGASACPGCISSNSGRGRAPSRNRGRRPSGLRSPPQGAPHSGHMQAASSVFNHPSQRWAIGRRSNHPLRPRGNFDYPVAEEIG